MQKTTGVEFSYENFVQAYDTVPALANMVSDYNEYGLTLADTPADNEEEQSTGTDAVASSAKRAAKNVMNRT